MNKRILIDATNVNIMRPGGGSYCTQAYIEAMLALYPGRVDVMHPKEAHIRDARYTTIDVPSRNRIRAICSILKGFFHRGAAFLIDYVKQHPDIYDTIFTSSGFYSGSIISTLRTMPIHFIVLHHNFESEYQIDSHSLFSLGGITDKFIRYWEKKGYKQADINLFLTQYDKSTFEREYGVHPHNYVTGVFEPTHTRQTTETQFTTNSAVITCSLEDIQNQASLQRFVDNYLPIYRQVLPGWTIDLMGRNPSNNIQILAKKNADINLIPNPVDLRSRAAHSQIYICPMDAGGGLKLRIMDGLRAGQPVLVHERSARGYDQFFGTPFFHIYHDTKSFCSELKEIILYLQSNQYSRAKVQAQYYDIFELNTGIKRLKKVFTKYSTSKS